MAKDNKVRRSESRLNGINAYRLSLRSSKVLKDVHLKKKLKGKEKKKEWVDATCAVCMEHPHNAVLLLCSSYNKGCRPYMCATSYRYSNCLEQYKKAYTKVSAQGQGVVPLHDPNDDFGFNLGIDCEKTEEISQLLCPLCRGQVKGWTVVEPARAYLNKKKRTCTQEKCSFVGTYKELRKHVRAEHPCGRPREVDPSLVEKWKKLEHERDQSDVISTIRSSMPGAIIIGDYVIERNYRGGLAGADYEMDNYFDDAFFRFESIGGGGNAHRMFSRGYRTWRDENIGNPSSVTTMATSTTSSGHSNRSFVGRTRRRRRHRAGSVD